MTWKDEIKKRAYRYDGVFLVKLREAIDDLASDLEDIVSEKDIKEMAEKYKQNFSRYEIVIMALEDEARKIQDQLTEDAETAKY
tara:strand:+ start:5083 stop:5334 length:252 start_codon:yes stop_codon:yes gene_type:complete